MHRNHRVGCAVLLAVLVGVGVGLRLATRDIPNFGPIAGLALFAGYVCPSWPLAAAVPLGAMAFSDLFLEGYEPLLRVTVYGMLTMPVVFGPLVRRWFAGHGTARTPRWAAVAGLVGCSVASSIAFFLVTNLVVWARWYPLTWSGLVECYVRAVPFFRYTLAGDLVFTFTLFGSWALLTRTFAARSTRAIALVSDSVLPVR